MKRLSLKPDAIGRARRLWRHSTDAEALIWRALRESLPHEKWRRQVPLGPYFADFASHCAKLIIEVDGSQHAVGVEADAARTSFLKSQGYRVLRFWNNEVLQNLDGVLATIAKALSPCGRGLGEGLAAPAATKDPDPTADKAALSGHVSSPLTPCPLPQGEREGMSKSRILES